MAQTEVQALPGLGEQFRVWLRIGLLSFGGPAAQIALIHREIVEQRGWIGERRFLQALNYCMLLPGPEAQQLATYMGWLMGRTLGGLIAGLLFLLPGALLMLVLAWLYLAGAELPIVDALFYGVKAAVLAIVIGALHRLGQRLVGSRAALAIAAGAFVALFLFRVPFPLVVLAALIAGLVLHRVAPGALPSASHGDATAAGEGLVDRLIARDPQWLPQARLVSSVRVLLTCLVIWSLPMLLVLLLAGAEHLLFRQGLFFSQVAVVSFGGAYAVLAYVAQHAVETLGWLSAGEMLDGLALAETTPGPLILVLEFVGALAAARGDTGLPVWLAASAGAGMSLWVIFAPSFLFIFVGAPWIERLSHLRGLATALAAVSAAVVGVILNLALWFALGVVFRDVGRLQTGPIDMPWPIWASLDPYALVLSLLALWLVLKRGLALPLVLLIMALLGLPRLAWV